MFVLIYNYFENCRYKFDLKTLNIEPALVETSIECNTCDVSTNKPLKHDYG